MITLSIVSWSPKQNGPIHYTFALSPFCFFLFLLFKILNLDHHHMSTPSPWSSFYVAISTHECHIAPSLGLDQPISNSHLEHRVSQNRFHQLTKTKLGHSPAYLNCSPFPSLIPNSRSRVAFSSPTTSRKLAAVHLVSGENEADWASSIQQCWHQCYNGGPIVLRWLSLLQ